MVTGGEPGHHAAGGWLRTGATIGVGSEPEQRTLGETTASGHHDVELGQLRQDVEVAIDVQDGLAEAHGHRRDQGKRPSLRMTLNSFQHHR